MKKCIASFLMCFVFAFGVITAFGCRDVVFASDHTVLFSGGVGVPMSSPNDFVLGSLDDCFLTYDNHSSSDYSTYYQFYVNNISSDDTNPLFFLVKIPYDNNLWQYYMFGYTNSVSTSGVTFDVTQAYWAYNPSDGGLAEYIRFSTSSNHASNKYTGVPTNANLVKFSYSYTSIGQLLSSNMDYSFHNIPIVTLSNCTDISSLTLDDIFSIASGNFEGADYDFSNIDVNYEFSEDIGYLSNLTVKQKNYENNATHQISRRVYSFFWGYESSTGVDLSDSRYSLEIKAQIKYKDLAFDDISIDDSPLCNAFKYDSDWTELHNSASNCLDAYNSDSIFSRTGFGTTYYFRIIDTESNLCGNWLKAYIDFDGVVNVSLVEETGNFDDSGSWVGDGNEFYGSGGVQNGDNESTYVPSDSSSKLDYSGIGDSISSLVDGVGQVPSVIAMLFSWLPTWVIVFLSVSIAIWGIMIVKKAIFG